MGCTNSQLANMNAENLHTDKKQAKNKEAKLYKIKMQSPNEKGNNHDQEEFSQHEYKNNAVKNKFQKRGQHLQIIKNSPVKSKIANIQQKSLVNSRYRETAVVTEVTGISVKDIETTNEQNNFINAILAQNRSKIILQNPQIPHKNDSFLKPVVEYKDNNKGRILSNQSQIKKSQSLWNQPISSPYQKQNNLQVHHSYMALNEPPKSPAKTQAINKRIRDIKIQSYESIQNI